MMTELPFWGGTIPSCHDQLLSLRMQTFFGHWSGYHALGLLFLINSNHKLTIHSKKYTSTLLSSKFVFFGFRQEANLWCLDLVLNTCHMLFMNSQLSYAAECKLFCMSLCFQFPAFAYVWIGAQSCINSDLCLLHLSNHQLPKEKNDFRSLCCGFVSVSASLYVLPTLLLIYIKLNCWTLLLVTPNHQLTLKMNDFWLLCHCKSPPVWTQLQY